MCVGKALGKLDKADLDLKNTYAVSLVEVDGTGNRSQALVTGINWRLQRGGHAVHKHKPVYSVYSA